MNQTLPAQFEPDSPSAARRHPWLTWRILLALSAALVAGGFGWAVLFAGPPVTPVGPEPSSALREAVTVIETYPDNAHAFGREDPWPRDMATFREYTQWLASQTTGPVTNPAHLATVTYVATSTGPCVQTYDTAAPTPTAIHWASGQFAAGPCPAAAPVS